MTSAGMEHLFKHDDPMIAQIDLAYALDARIAKGLTTYKGIAVMDSRTRKLLSSRTFPVTITHLRDEFTLLSTTATRLKSGSGATPATRLQRRRSPNGLELPEVRLRGSDSARAKRKRAA